MISRRRDCRPRSIQTFYDFARCEYIENSSTAYINPNYKTNANTIIELDVQITTVNVQARIIGNASGYFESYINGSSRFAFTSNGLLYSSGVSANTIRRIIKLDNTISKGYIDDTEVKITKNASKYYNTIYLIARGETNNLKCKIYGCKIYDGETMVRDFIPMYQISTDTYGLWDRVENKFYTSPNGVKFTGGERVIADANDNLYYLKDYIKCNGTTNTFIDLSKFTNLDNVEFEVYSNAEHDNFIGSRSGKQVKNYFQIAKWSNTRIDICFGQQSPTFITSKNTGSKKFKIKLWERIVYLDNEIFYTCPNNTFTTNTVVSLGAVKGLAKTTSARFYWFKWWNKDKDLIYDMIPVQRISDGVWGMFCKVHLGFYPSNGSAQFTGG